MNNATVLLMSTDLDIINTPLVNTPPEGWIQTARYSYAQVAAGGLNLANGINIVVIAHGNNQSIGNSHGLPDIDAATFLNLIRGNMAAGAAPGALFISACAQSIAGFAASVAIAAGASAYWQHTRIFGHTDSVVGPVPAYRPKDNIWTEIFQ